MSSPTPVFQKTATAYLLTRLFRRPSAYKKQTAMRSFAVFEENDISASKYSKKPQPLYNQVLELVRANKVDMIWSTEMERLRRRPRELDEPIDLAETTDLKEIYFTSDEGYSSKLPTVSTGPGVPSTEPNGSHAKSPSELGASKRIERTWG